MSVLQFPFRFRTTDWATVVANLIPIYGVWFLGWSATDAFVVYALETLIAGVITILKLGLITLVRKKDSWQNGGATVQVSGLFFILFFVLHFGLFAAVQTSIFSESAHLTSSGGNLLFFFFNWYKFLNSDITTMLCGFVISYLVRNFLPFVISGEYKTASMARVMFQPYGRIVIQQFTVIIGSMFLSFNWGRGFILVFGMVKILFEVFFNLEDKINQSMKEAEMISREDKDRTGSV